MKKSSLFILIMIVVSSMALQAAAQETETPAPAPSVKEEQKTETPAPEATSPEKPKEETAKPEAAVPAQEKQIIDTENVYFPVPHLNLFNYGIGLVFGIDPIMYGFLGILGYRHLNPLGDFTGPEGGTRVALDIMTDIGISIASKDGDSFVSGFAALTLAPNILWFKSLAEENFDRSGNGIFIGARIEAAYSKDGFLLSYGPAIGWTSMYYNSEKKKFKVTNVVLFFYPPTLVLGLAATTNF